MILEKSYLLLMSCVVFELNDFTELIENYDPDTSRVSEIFKVTTHYFKMYNDYANGYENSSTV